MKYYLLTLISFLMRIFNPWSANDLDRKVDSTKIKSLMIKSDNHIETYSLSTIVFIILSLPHRI